MVVHLEYAYRCTASATGIPRFTTTFVERVPYVPGDERHCFVHSSGATVVAVTKKRFLNGVRIFKD